MINIYEHPNTKKKLDGMIKGFYKKNMNYFKKESIDIEDFYQEVYLKLLKTPVYHEDNIESYIILSSYCHMKNLWRRATKKYADLGHCIVNTDIKKYENIIDDKVYLKETLDEDFNSYVQEEVIKNFEYKQAFIILEYFFHGSTALETSNIFNAVYGKETTARQIFYVVEKNKQKIKKIVEQAKKFCF